MNIQSIYLYIIIILHNNNYYHSILSFCQPSPIPTDTEPSGSGGLSGGAVAGIVCTLLVVLLVVGISATVIAMFTRKRMQSSKQEGMNNPVYGTFKCLSIHYIIVCLHRITC